MTRYVQCRVPGCTARGAPRWVDGHEGVLHVQCICGWVGVSIGRHVAQRRRWGHPDRLHGMVRPVAGP